MTLITLHDRRQYPAAQKYASFYHFITFTDLEASFLAAIDEEADTIQTTYQQTLNKGLKDMAVFDAICAIIGALLLIPYRKKAPKGTM